MSMIFEDDSCCGAVFASAGLKFIVAQRDVLRGGMRDRDWNVLMLLVPIVVVLTALSFRAWATFLGVIGVDMKADGG